MKEFIKLDESYLDTIAELYRQAFCSLFDRKKIYCGFLYDRIGPANRNLPLTSYADEIVVHQ